MYLHRVGPHRPHRQEGHGHLHRLRRASSHTLTALEKKYGIKFEDKKLPTPEEARRLWTERHVVELKEAMSASIFEAFIPLSQELRNRPDGEFLVAFALKYFFTHHRMERAQDREKAEHKREEHVRRDRARCRREGRGRDRIARTARRARAARPRRARGAGAGAAP